MRKGNGTRTAKEEIRAKADEKDIEYSKCRGDGAKLVEVARRVPVEALEPEKVATRRGIDTSVPKEYVPNNEHIDLRCGKHAFDCLKREPFRCGVSRTLKTGFCQRNVPVVENKLVRFVRSARPDEEPKDP